MLRDVFYFNKKPNAHARERHANNLDHARQQSTTEHFWIINEFCDYREFDWEWDFDYLPDEDVWSVDHNNVWPSRHQKDSGTWLCPAEPSDIVIYRADVNPIARKKELDPNWNVIQEVDINKFDFSWHPDAGPAYIYVWGNKWNPVEMEAALEYHCRGATEVKYMTDVVEILPETNRWSELITIDHTSFDFTWRPDPREPPYIYVWGNTQYPGTVMPTVEYHCRGATERKYIDNVVVRLAAGCTMFEYFDDVESFDASWAPDPKSPPFIYVWGNQWNSAENRISVQHTVDGATEYKYMPDRVQRRASVTNWSIPETIDATSFDFSWEPNPKDPPYIYQFGTQWAKTHGPRYVVAGATEIKYVDILVAKRLANKEDVNWKINLAISDFDFSWHPDSTDQPYIYVFGNQWNSAELEPTVEYHIPGATEKKYISNLVATLAPYTRRWETLEEVAEFDYSWRPNPTSPPYIYVFGNTQYPGTIMPTVKLHVRDAVQEKFIDIIVAKLAQKPELFENTELVSEFDYSWRPNPTSPPYVYQFGTQWAKTHGPRYVVAGATDTKFVSGYIATILPDMTNWKTSGDIDVSNFDFSWHPDATSPPYIYRFGTLVDKNDGPRYITPGNTGIAVYLERTEIKTEAITVGRYNIKTTLESLILEHPDELFWALNSDLDYSAFDFSWRPSIEQSHYVHAFGSSDSIDTQTYFVNGTQWHLGNHEVNYVEGLKVDVKTKIDMYFVDRGNPEVKERFAALKRQFPDIQKTRYLNSWVDTINRCINRSSTNLSWILNSELDYTGFDFNYYPNTWQMKMVHVFGTQWSHWGSTFMVNRDTFAEDTKYIKIIEHLSNLNFIKDRKAKATNVLYDIVYIDHGNMTPAAAGQQVFKYEESYFNTFKKMLDKLPVQKEHYLWVCSSVCDYRGFDFTYICDPFAREQLHVFPSEKQKFGDTFLINVNKLRELVTDMTVLEDYTKINYNQHQRVKRLPAPHIITTDDTHINSAKSDFNFPYAVLTTADNADIKIVETEPMSLWAPDHKNIIVTSVGGTRIIVPAEAKNYITKELYDYPYIISTARLAKSTPMDIVFLSNGEEGADSNYDHLLKLTEGLPNKVVRVDGVLGRVAAYHAAAEASTTPWMFTVFAKLKVNPKFDWNWQPDRLQIPKHYIFHATNPVNGLEYGHQAMIAYNKNIVLNNTGRGLDFTLDDEHEVVEINSGTANFNTDAWSTWRTAFREAIKLRASSESSINAKRLHVWLNTSSGNFAEYSILGASDAVQYYDEVAGDINKLRLSYDWPWLRARFDSLRK